MKAVRLTRFGDPDVLIVTEMTDLTPNVGEARIRVEAASINPSDVKNVQGAMSQTTLPRTPGRDYAGVVEAGPEVWLGAEVWGTGGDVGFTRDGTHAQQLIVPLASLRCKPSTLSFEQAASVGVNYMAAWRGLVDGAGLGAGETLAIIGAGGGVGNAAAQIAKRIGVRVIGVDRSPPRPDAEISRIADPMIVGVTDAAAAVRDATQGRGADVVFDTVGGVMFRQALACLAVGGRLIEISATGAREVSFDLANFYHNETRLIGVDTLKLGLTRSAEVLEALRPGFEAGDYKSAPIARTFPLHDAVAAYQAVAGGERGRVVLRPLA
jgi:NADPH:quinone reductase